MSIEVELKLSASADKIQQVKDWLKEAGCSEENSVELEWEQKILHNTYFDTKNHRLRETDIGLRIRKDGERYIQSVKSAGRVVGGLYQRNESEHDISKSELQLELVDEPYLMILLEEAEEEDGPFMPIFTTNFSRDVVTIDYNGAQVEVALDQGQINCMAEDMTDTSQELCEVELELKDGEASVLFELGKKLIEKFDLALDSESKAERGYRLCHSAPEYTKHLNLVNLTSKTSAEAAFESVAHKGLEHWQYHIKKIKRGPSIEAVLQLNRALMFMQTMYSVFAAVIPRHSLIHLRKDWREITQNFSKLFTIAEEINWLKNSKLYGFHYKELELLEEGLEQAFKKAHQRFVEYLMTPSYNLKLLRFSRWLYLKEWREAIGDSNADKIQKKEIYPYATKQLQHLLRDMRRHLSEKVTLSKQDYIEYLPKMSRTLDIGLFFGCLFDDRARREYRRGWADIVANIQLLQQLVYLEKALEAEGVEDPLIDDTETETLVVLKGMREEALARNPYWN
ncbi:CYTH and CHAD domain-containing protein [Kangiella geojedonensis]|uniref:Adenylate cyclase n=1 Tax=Kangiella geojedonensis TaxID=914150 RepID=A0A0F6RBB4_9GAMM|nr:CYTH and CHAD domain-containing protein [Kangiella geojedonensis]AKE51408.1 Adenylate cyclase [Kangiella geojedonensis]